MNRLLDWYYIRCQRYSSWRFLLELLILSFVLKMIPAICMGLFGIEEFTTTTDVISEDGASAIVISALLIAPVIETFIGQWIPILLISWITRKRGHIMLWPSLFFASLHLYAGVWNIFIIFPAALVFTWCFYVQYANSLWKALLLTAILHALHNSIACGIYFMA